MAETKEHIVLIPFMAQGHIIPFLALALHLEQNRNCTITFVNTPLNINKLRSSLPPTSSIRLLEFPFNSSEYGLPPNTENTDSLPYDLILQFLASSLHLKPTLTRLISHLSSGYGGFETPLCIITDMFFSWCADIAHEFGIFHVIFNAGCGYGFACYYSLWLNLPHQDTDSDEFTLPDFPEASKFHVTQLAEFLRTADGTDPFSAFQRKVLTDWAKADGILFNTVGELDKLGLMYFRRKFGKPVWPIGPVLLSSGAKARAGKEGGITPETCKTWLDSKPDNSVLYISFGSQNTISASQIMQLAIALETSGKNFIWVVRPPLGLHINSEFKAKEWLPEGFEVRMEQSETGLIVDKWAPQLDILSHTSVSAFLSHCGWNSILESLSFGVPLMGWPLNAEQFYNSKLLEVEIGVSVEVARGKSWDVKHEDLRGKIELVMGETEKAKAMRRKACEVGEMIKEAIKEGEGGLKGSSVKAMDKFLNAALLNREKNKADSNSKLQSDGN